MFKKAVYLFIFLALIAETKAQNNSTKTNERPKLVVGVIVDQMRYDYLTRFYSKYSEGGFKRLMHQGFNCKNNHFNYIPTKTAPGHASVFSGTTPKYHGIIANDWYDKQAKEKVYCVADSNYQSVGVNTNDGQMSPHRMKTTTLADENKMFTQLQGKTIGISIKDRGAILPAGHSADAAFWFYGKDKGHFITSTFYMNELPKWVKQFNNSNIAESYLKVWDTYYDIKTYTESGNDLNTFEGGFKGQETATFPYNLKTLSKHNNGFDIIKGTAYGNSIVADFAIAAITGEQLGQDNITDVLTVSFSSTDYVGHNFGVNSKEIEDTYIRLDLDLERFLNALDKKVGKGNYTLFLTADHAAVDVPAYLQSINIPAGYIDTKTNKEKLKEFLLNKYKDSDLVENVSNDQIFLNREKIKEMGLELSQVQADIVNEIIEFSNVYKAYTATTMATNNFTSGIESLLEKGYNQKRSGDILFVYDPAFISYSKTGSTHGSGFNYDTHVPLLFYGKGIKHGETLKKTDITDIAPTISAYLGISFPNGNIGQPLEFVLE